MYKFILLTVVLSQFVYAKKIEVNLKEARFEIINQVTNDIKISNPRFGHFREKSSNYITKNTIHSYLNKKLPIIFNSIHTKNTELNNEQITHQLVVREWYKPLYQDQMGRSSKITGFGLYRMGANLGDTCAYHVLNFEIIELKNNKKQKFNSSHPMFSPYTKDQKEVKCVFHKQAKNQKMKWKKSFDRYNDLEKKLIYESIKEKIIPNLVRTLLNIGFFESENQANTVMLDAIKDEYIIIEKNDDFDYLIDDKIVLKDNISAQLQSIIDKSGKKKKLIIGFQTKSKFTFGDLRKIFIPAFKETKFKLFRLGKASQLIKL
ncbi:MAG: hypothetical protein JKY19_01615 [Alcanivoracaceae bacterium]|nr:hypothetical protein [Alcanivoracaceae bacterium]